MGHTFVWIQIQFLIFVSFLNPWEWILWKFWGCFRHENSNEALSKFFLKWQCSSHLTSCSLKIPEPQAHLKSIAWNHLVLNELIFLFYFFFLQSIFIIFLNFDSFQFQSEMIGLDLSQNHFLIGWVKIAYDIFFINCNFKSPEAVTLLYIWIKSKLSSPALFLFQKSF